MNNFTPVTSPYTFLGNTQSLCPECLALVQTKIIARGQRIYFRKRCPTHGVREDFICSDRRWYDRYDTALPARLPRHTQVEPDKGCPFDCGLCTDHEQHTCVAVLEITDNCNLTCSMCYADSRPGQKHKSYEEVCRAIDTLVAAEGQPDVLQLSGGEPTLHPDFERILEYALKQPIHYVMINTNGIRLSNDQALVDAIALHKNRVEIYLQMDGCDDEVFQVLRGQRLLETKLRAIERLGSADLNITLVATLQAGVNESQLGKLLNLAAGKPWISGLSLQPATYSGRYFTPEQLESRITAPDCIRLLCEQSSGELTEDDFFPLPCAHPNCHVLSLCYRHEGKLVPLTRFVDAASNRDLLANGLSFTRDEGKRLAQLYLARNNCCGPNGCSTNDANRNCSSDSTSQSTSQSTGQTSGQSTAQTTAQAAGPLVVLDKNPAALADEFFAKAIEKQIGSKQMLRITITSFLDAYNFDVRRVMKCCTHHVLPSGHIIPFCAYNVLYRNGHVPLPDLKNPLVSNIATRIQPQ